jgi:hypothetical protein
MYDTFFLYNLSDILVFFCFVESPVHESTTFNQTIKQSSQDWADKLKKSKY